MAKRPIIASVCRGKQILIVRYYSRITTALPRGVGLLLEQGQPGDVVEYASVDHGYQIGTVSIHAGGKLNVKFNPSLVTE